jgi:uncharacterized protein
VILAALVAGLATGAVMARGGLCFNRAVRRAAFEHRPELLRAFAVAVAVQLLLLPLLVAAGVGPLARSAEAGGPPLLPVAQVAGGLVFGAGMALAGGCVTGMLWKAGSGALALAVAIAGFAVGELLIRGPGSGIIADLDGASAVRRGSVPELLGTGYAAPALVVGVVALWALLGGSRRGPLAAPRGGRGPLAALRGLHSALAGLALGVVAAGAWVAADAAGYGYGLGFVGAAEGARGALESGGELPFQLWLAVGVVAGAAVAGPRRLRVPDAARASRALAGGLLMGAGGSVAHGCNIGHGLTGLPLLSFGSLLATACMAAGALLTWRLLLASRPTVRGRERTA